MSDKPQEENIKDQIIGLLEKGYKRDQLIKDFKFAERTVDAAIRAYKEFNNGGWRFVIYLQHQPPDAIG